MSVLLRKIEDSDITRPLMHLFAKNKIVDTMSGLLTSTRATTATIVDDYGIIRTADADEIRYNKDGVLLEGAGTNLALWSEDFSNAAWNPTASTITQNTAISPDGTLTADLWTDNGTNAHFLSQSISVDNGGVYTLSCWVKRNSTLANANFTILVSGGQSGDDLVATTEWVRYEYTVTVNDTSKLVGLGRNSLNKPSDLLIWGMQVEKLPAISSYIPTTTVAVTRAADNITLPSHGNAPDISKSFSISLLVNNLQGDLENSLDYIWHIFCNESTSAEKGVFLVRNSNGQLLLRYSDAVTNKDIFVAPSSDTLLLVTVFDGTFMHLYKSATTKNTVDTTGVSITTDTTKVMSIGKSPSTLIQNYNGNYKDFRVYDYALNAAQVAQLHSEVGE